MIQAPPDRGAVIDSMQRPGRMSTIGRLSPSQLAQRCDPAQFAFAHTGELEDLDESFGQDRAKRAIEFGVGIRRDGYNLYALGPPGAGKQTLLRQVIGRHAATATVPDDWCYVNNFDLPHRPRALRLPAGRGAKLRDAMRKLVEELLAAIPAVFDSDEYRARTEQIDAEFSERHDKAFTALAEQASAQDIALLRTPTGFTLAPLRSGEVITPEAFAALSADEQQKIEKTIGSLQEVLAQLLRDGQRWRKERRERIRALNREVASYAVGREIEEVRQAYADLPDVVAYLGAVEHDLVENIDNFRRGSEPAPVPLPILDAQAPNFRRYEVNLLLDRSEPDGVPVVYEDLPTHPNLLGRIEHIAHLGALITDFTLIKAGALHRANGGYLLLDVHKLLAQPFAWEGLKRALTTRRIRIESLGQMYSFVSTTSLEPEPIPLDVKVVLFGERSWYYLLFALDPDFAELFKVAVDFDDEVARTSSSQALLARLIATLARHHALLPFDRAAVARLIEDRAREVEDSERLSTNVQSLVDLMTEADFGARRAGAALVGAADVDAAIAAGIERAGRLRQRMHEEIMRGSVLIDTDGEQVGQINGLSVFALGGHLFAKPTRITAKTRIGDGEVIDVQREVELGGPIHSKGVMILASFLAARFSGKRPHPVRASIVFEQTYGTVEGDSASAAELCALLSSLADAPLRQSVAITGSVNQSGEMQAIGAVNQKIEGFFDICKARGLTGEHAVVIPASNAKNLMLREDVIAAAAAGQFHVHAVRTIDEAIEIMTGVAAGELSSTGEFPPHSINQRVASRLREFLAVRQAHAGIPAARKWPARPRRGTGAGR
jgi:predicted ATP-dependent protease